MQEVTSHSGAHIQVWSALPSVTGGGVSAARPCWPLPTLTPVQEPGPPPPSLRCFPLGTHCPACKGWIPAFFPRLPPLASYPSTLLSRSLPFCFGFPSDSCPSLRLSIASSLLGSPPSHPGLELGPTCGSLLHQAGLFLVFLLRKLCVLRGNRPCPVPSFLPSFDKRRPDTCCVTGPVLGTADAVVTRTDKTTCSWELRL